MVPRLVPLLLIVVSLIFWVATVLNYRKAGGNWTIAGRIYRRTATIFAAIGIGLYLLQASVV